MAFTDNPPPHRRWLGTKIATARVQQDLTAVQLSEKMAADGHSVSDSTIRDIERGVTSSKWDTICLLSDFLGLNLWGDDLDAKAEPEDSHPGYIDYRPDEDKALEVVTDSGLTALLHAMKARAQITVTLNPKDH